LLLFQHNRIQSKLQEDINYLANSTGFNSIFKRGEINNTKQDVTDAINEQAVIVNEILRRQYAEKFFNALKNEINTHKNNKF